MSAQDTALNPSGPFEALGEAERAAIIVMLLGDDEAAKILAHLDPEELQCMGEKMVELGDISPDRIASAIQGFVNSAQDDSMSARGRHDHVRQVMTRALGHIKADSLMQRIAPDQKPSRSLELARWLAPQVLAPLICDEHPQVLAVLLLQLNPDTAAQVLTLLPPASQPEIIHRIATLGPVAPVAVDMLDELLSARIAERFGFSALTMGGAAEAADIINNASSAVEKAVMSALTERDADLAEAIEMEMFKFEQLFILDPLGMGRLLRDVENDVLVDALKGIGEEERECFFRAMSSRAADGVRDEIEMRGRLKREDVEAAQQTMIAKARELAEEGEISMGGGDGEFV